MGKRRIITNLNKRRRKIYKIFYTSRTIVQITNINIPINIEQKLKCKKFKSNKKNKFHYIEICSL